MTARPETAAWVLWHRYGDGSSATIERVYLDEVRAQEDFKLLTEGTRKIGAYEWKLDIVPVMGAGELPCQHEWYQGKCVHCERTPADVRTPPRPISPEGADHG
jgi:hypothetical protein